MLMLFLDSFHGLILVTGGLQCAMGSIFRVGNKLKEIIKETVLTFTKSCSGLQWRRPEPVLQMTQARHSEQVLSLFLVFP